MGRAVGGNKFPPDFLQETMHAFDAAGIPRFHRFQGTEKHQIESERIRAVRLDDRIRTYDIAAALRHFFAVFAEDDPLME